MPDLFLELRDESGGDEETPAPLPEEEALTLLRDAEFSASRLIPWGSNYSFAVALEAPDGRSQLAIYKPQAGEAPLYDFPDGTLYLREYAAYLFSRWAGWDLVPPTVVRDGPRGVGSVQLYVQPEGERPSRHDFWGSRDGSVERLVLFDHLVNNADRKISHCLRDSTGKVWGIDHGLTFNREPKLRTVLWQFVGEPISPPLLRELQGLRDRADELPATLKGVLSGSEIQALLRRIGQFAEHGCYPVLSPRRNVPYGWW
ncbi:MAG: SCO1664 family protein [Thermomicrobiales bacterium]